MSIQEGRPINKIGAHVGGHNRDSIGIGYVGGTGKIWKNGLIQEQISKSSLFNLLMDLKFGFPDVLFMVIMIF